eukprot:IDg15645t1
MYSCFARVLVTHLLVLTARSSCLCFALDRGARTIASPPQISTLRSTDLLPHQGVAESEGLVDRLPGDRPRDPLGRRGVGDYS